MGAVRARTRFRLLMLDVVISVVVLVVLLTEASWSALQWVARCLLAVGLGGLVAELDAADQSRRQSDAVGRLDE